MLCESILGKLRSPHLIARLIDFDRRHSCQTTCGPAREDPAVSCVRNHAPKARKPIRKSPLRMTTRRIQRTQIASAVDKEPFFGSDLKHLVAARNVVRRPPSLRKERCPLA